MIHQRFPTKRFFATVCFPSSFLCCIYGQCASQKAVKWNARHRHDCLERWWEEGSGGGILPPVCLHPGGPIPHHPSFVMPLRDEQNSLRHFTCIRDTSGFIRQFSNVFFLGEISRFWKINIILRLEAEDKNWSYLAKKDATVAKNYICHDCCTRLLPLPWCSPALAPT